MLERNLVLQRPLALMLTVCVSLAMAVGCQQELAPPKGPSGKVKGKVTVKGQPLTTGAINFLSSDGIGASSLIGPDGSYSLDSMGTKDVPVKTYKVSLSAPAPDPSKAAPGKMPETPKLPGVDASYLNGETSGWTATVKEGDNTFDFDVKDVAPKVDPKTGKPL